MTGQIPGDPLNSMETEVETQAGAVTNTYSGQNWGDYSSMAIDGQDGCTFWYAQEYFGSSGTNWQTRLVKFHFPRCTSYPH